MAGHQVSRPVRRAPEDHHEGSRPGLRAFHGFLLGFSGRATDHLIQEFVYRWLTTHVPKTVARRQPVLRGGTPVPLFSVEDLRSATTGTARPVTFVLSKDLEGGSVRSPPKPGPKQRARSLHSRRCSAQAAVHSTHLLVEKRTPQDRRDGSPLRSTPQKAGTGVLEYHRPEDTCRIALVRMSPGCNTRTDPVAPTGPPHAIRQRL